MTAYREKEPYEVLFTDGFRMMMYFAQTGGRDGGSVYNSAQFTHTLPSAWKISDAFFLF